MLIMEEINLTSLEFSNLMTSFLLPECSGDEETQAMEEDAEGRTLLRFRRNCKQKI